MQAVRTLAQAQPSDVINDCSAELFELRSLLDDARDVIYANTGQSRYKTCTRCNQQFDEFTKDGLQKASCILCGWYNYRRTMGMLSTTSKRFPWL